MSTQATQPAGDPAGARRVIDTAGNANLTPIYVAVVLVEVAVLTALWFFSAYFSG